MVTYHCNSCQVLHQSGKSYFWASFDVLVKVGRCCGQGITLWSINSLSSHEISSYLGPFKENRAVDCRCNSWRVTNQGRKCFLGDFRLFWMIYDAFCGRAPLFDLVLPSWALETLPRIIFNVNIEWVITNFQLPGSVLEQKVVLWVVLDTFGPFQAVFVVMESLSDLEIPSWALETIPK